MRLFILGASGKTGTQLVDLALARAPEVTAFVRSPGKITHRHPLLKVHTWEPKRMAFTRSRVRSPSAPPTQTTTRRRARQDEAALCLRCVYSRVRGHILYRIEEARDQGGKKTAVAAAALGVSANGDEQVQWMDSVVRSGIAGADPSIRAAQRSPPRPRGDAVDLTARPTHVFSLSVPLRLFPVRQQL